MKVIQISAKVLSDEGNPVSQFSVSLEIFQLAQRKWIVKGSGKTNTKGDLSIKANFPTSDIAAPIMRLTEFRSTGPRILAHSPYLQYDTRAQLLTADFGIIEHLDDMAFRIQQTNQTFARVKSLISGQAKRPNIVMTPIIRTLAAQPANRNVNISTNATLANRAATVSLSDNVRANDTLATANVAPVALDHFNAELIKFRSTETKLQQKIEAKDRTISSKETELLKSKKRVTELEKEITKVKESEFKLKQENTVFTNESERLTPIASIASNIGTQIHSANTNLKGSANPYQIQNIQLELRGSLGNNGESIALHKLADSSDHAQLIKVDMATTDKAVSIDDITVPDITGLTETVVKRLLKSVGLQAETIQKSVGLESKYTLGQAISQSPAPSSKTPPNQKVMVVFATE